MSVFNLQAPFEPSGDQPLAISKLVDGLKQGLAYQTLLGVTGSGKTFTMAHVIAQLERPALILAPNKTLAAQLYGEMKSFFPNHAVEYFVSYYDYYQPEAYVPSTDTYIAKDAAINDHIEQMRLSATRSLLERSDTIIVATVSAIYGLGDPRMYLQMVLHLVEGDAIDQRTILRRLAELQYTRHDLDLQRGRFRVRGDIIDVYPADSDKDAVRIELWDGEVVNLCYLDPLTGKTLRKVSRLTIYPKTHYVTAREKILSAVEEIKRDLQIRLAELKQANKLLEFQRLEERTQYDLAMLEEIGYCQGIENYSRYLSGAAPGEPPPTLFDYLPKNSLLFIDESHVTIPQLHAMYRGDRARKQTLVEYGFRLPAALDNRPLMFEEFSARAPQTIYISATPSAFERAQSDQIVEQVARPTGLLDPEIEIRPVKTQIDDLLDEIKKTIPKHERVLVTTLTKRLSEDLTDFLTEQQIKVRYLHSDIDTVERVDIIRDFRLGVFDVLVGINLLREGLDLPEVSRVAILDADKEGFLRSETALIQTIGRVARNFNGKAILYADTMTGSMERAISETNRRRDIQKKYNEEHGITPKSVERAVHDVMDSAYGESSVRGRLFGGADSQSKTQSKSKSQFGKTKEKSHEKNLKGEALQKEFIRLREKMMAHAVRLEFEEAARLRDEMERLKK